MIHSNPHFPIIIKKSGLSAQTGIGSLINYQAHDMELKRPWHIFSVEVLWNAP